MKKKNNILLITKVTLEHFPSKKEIMNLLETFIYDHNYHKDYQLYVDNNTLSIQFRHSDAADGFIKHLREQKLSNNLYSKLKITIAFTPVQDYSSKSTKAKLRRLLSLHNHKCALQKHDSCPIIMSKKEAIPAKRIVQKYSTISLNASEAYIDNYQKEKEEIRKNKIKWLDHRNFNSYVGKASDNKLGYIGNYVVRDFSIPANRFQLNLRVSKKYQWVEDKGFL